MKISTLSPLSLHKKLQGKLTIESKIPIKNKHLLSLIYTPGVASVSKYIVSHPESVSDVTIKRNTVAVVTDGSAVLGLGNIGADAALPVMEGKCMLFKEFAGINAFPICLKTQIVSEIVNIITNISPVFGAINLEDISSPRCFEIEEKLQNIGIPVMHDDQHATAIVVLAGLVNSVKVVNKNLANAKIVIVGSGAAGIAIVKLLAFLNIKNILLVDSEGIISRCRSNLPFHKSSLLTITNPQNIKGGLIEAAKQADILIGVSKNNIFTRKIITSMSENPIVFALANPDPELPPQKAKAWGVKVYATGRSDLPNQVNNALVFPGFFKGLLKAKENKISSEMKTKAAYALANLIAKPESQKIIPSIFDKRVVPCIVKSITGQ